MLQKSSYCRRFQRPTHSKHLTNGTRHQPHLLARHPLLYRGDYPLQLCNSHRHPSIHPSNDPSTQHHHQSIKQSINQRTPPPRSADLKLVDHSHTRNPDRHMITSHNAIHQSQRHHRRPCPINPNETAAAT